MRRSKLSLLALAGLLLFFSLGGCSPPWTVVVQAVPNPMLGKGSFTVQPIDFTGLRVGEKTEASWLAEKDEEQRSSWLEDKKGMNDEFASNLINEAKDEGIQVSPPSQQAPFIVQPKVEWLEPGFYAYVAKRPSQMRMTVRISDANNNLVDEITLSHSTAAAMTNPSSGGRLRDDAEALGKYVARYLKSRVAPEPE